MQSYYVVVGEWNYPTESGGDPVDITFDDREEALDFAKKMCEDEQWNYMEATRCSSSSIEYREDDGTEGYIITDMNDNEPFYFYARIIKIEPLNIDNHITFTIR